MKKRILILMAALLVLTFFTGTVAFAAPQQTTLHAKVPAALLKDPGISAGTISPGFSEYRYGYRIRLAEGVGSITFTPVPETSGAALWINGVSSSTSSSQTFSVENGRSISVRIRVQNAGQTRIYVFVVTRDRATNNRLASLGVSAGSLSPAFDPAVLNYTVNLDEFTASTTITATLENPALAKATFLKKTVGVLPGQTRTILLKVRAQNGSSQTYVIKLIRQASSNANLKMIKPSRFALSPVFDKNTAAYTITLPASSSHVILYVQKDGYRSTVTMDGIRRTFENVKLAAGQTKVVKIIVTAQDGVTIKEYDVAVIRSAV